MSLANKLFEVINDEPVYTPVLINLPCFKKLYLEDKSNTKSTYSKHLAFIWYYCDVKSPYKDSEDRLKDCMFAAYGKNIVITKTLQACIDEYVKRQSTAETRSLDSALKMCDEMIATLQKNSADNEEYYRLIKDLDDKMKEEDDIDERITYSDMKLKLEDAISKKIKDNADLIPKINKLVESTLDLRSKLKKVIEEIDTNSNRESIVNFIIYDVIKMNNK